jgi:D,D-heptose 1,7-bisphosphate phosphatase
LKTAVILAGGKGTRMGMLASEVPKPMLKVNGQPLLAYQVEWLKRYGFEEIWMITNHLGDVIEAYFGPGDDFGLSIKYYREVEPLGTVGGIKALEQLLQEDFLVLYGDTLLDIDFPRMLQFHMQKSAAATLLVHPNDHPYDSDLVQIDANDRITAFLPKPHEPEAYYRNMVNAALYILSPLIFPFLQQGVKADFGKDIFPKLCKELPVFGYNTPEYIKDMGTPGRLEAVTEDLLSGKVAGRNLRHLQRAIFIDRDGVMNLDKGLICHYDDFELYEFVPEAIRLINRTDFIAVVVTNQPGIAKGMYDFHDLEMIHMKMDTLLGRAGAKLDALYFCPHHPEKGFEGERPQYKVSCDCRKPASGMLLKAAERFHIDLSRSYLIGDHERDIIAGKRVGCTTIGVETGHALSMGGESPDYRAKDLLSAVKLIIDLETIHG